MKISSKKNLREKIFNLLLLNVIFLASFLGNVKNVHADTFLNVNFPKDSIVELLKLEVPKNMKEAWLKAEKKTWEPWLLKQNGFLGRQLFWNPKDEEATLLIGWESRSLWKSISQSEINLVQKNFEKVARLETGLTTENPFPLIYEGELNPE